ncbi:MAG: hypothetical protein R2746_01835 [Acidimicrobiales bacterium]
MSAVEVPWCASVVGVPTVHGADLGARRRHPAGRPQGTHLVGPLQRLVDALPEPRGPHWEVAFAVMAVRGSQARSRTRFAVAYGLSDDVVRRLEAGAVPLADVPAPLRALTPVELLVHELGRLPHPA